MMNLMFAALFDVYALTMSLAVPQVFDNTQSAGYRKYQTQKVTGEVKVSYDGNGNMTGISCGTLKNHKFKVGGKNVTYQVFVGETPSWVYIGSNRKDKFTTPCVMMELECEPSYALKGLTNDSALILVLAGKGSAKTCKGSVYPYKFSGGVAGTLGCGCADYGHKSPTRKIGFIGPKKDEVSDIAPVYGSFTMKYKRSGEE